MKPAEIESPVSSLISNEFEEFASLHIAKKSLDFQVNLALQLLRGRYSPPQTQAQDMFPSCLRTAVSCCKVSSFSTGSKETSWRLHLGGQMQEVVMSNTHLTSSLLENYSTVNRFMIYIYIYTLYNIYIYFGTFGADILFFNSNLDLTLLAHIDLYIDDLSILQTLFSYFGLLFS